MKRLAITLSLSAFGVFFAASNAFMQGGSKPRLDAPPTPRQQSTAPIELPKTYLNKNRLHKLIITDKDKAVYDALASANAIRNETDYGGYKLIVVDEVAAGGRAALQAMPIATRDDQNMMVFNGYLIDSSDPRPLSRELPVNLKQSRMSAALTGATSPGKGFYIVQFVGPIQDSWLKTLEKTGAGIITYAPNNAYVVRVDDRAAGELIKMKESSPFVQWLGDFEPGYKLTPELQTIIARGESKSIRVTVQMIDSAEADLKIDELRALSPQYFKERRVLKYRNITVIVSASQLISLANSDVVLAIEEDHERKRADEVQGQIVAGNLTGNAPSSPGYLAWLANKGFNSSQFSSFSVNVADDAYSLAGHPDLPNSRVAFENNPTNMTGPQKGHGFLNSHIIGGFNDGAGSAYEDANGFNYGLGIAPWARVGVTAIFGPGAFSPSAWEEVAYGQSARISSNSWFLDFTWRYDTFAQEYDSIVRDAQRGTPGNQELAVVFCAGNDALFGAGTVTSPGSAKNVITVGASENVRQTGFDGCGVDNTAADSANDIAFFSSRGPVNSFGGDGRVKPDIVAPGTHIQAGIPQSNYDGGNVCDKYFPAGQTLYSWSSGTSHSTPAVAGGAALIYQDYLNKNMAPPSPAMVKALLMNSASYMTGAGANDTLPSNNQGMGLMNLGRTFDEAPRLLTDQTRVFGSSGETYRVVGSVAVTNQPVRVTLAWTDAPGSPISAPWVNNLDLEVTINGQTYRGNVFSGADSTTGGAPDGKNNAESVFLPAGVSGNFLVTVRAINIAGDGVPGDGDTTDQDFALVVYNANSGNLDSPIIDVNPSNLRFTAVAGSSASASQTFNINNAGAGALDWTVSDDAPWLTVSPTSGGAPSTLTASVDVGGLAAGTYSASITVHSPNAFNPSVSVPVTLTVLPIFTAPSTLFFSTFDGTNPPNRTFEIGNNDSVPRAWTVSDDVPWLTVSPTSGTAPSTLTASVNISGLLEGAYTGTITISPNNAPSLAVKIVVRLTVRSPLLISPSSLSFAATFGANNPTNQTIELFNVFNGVPLQWTAIDDAPWLTVSPTTGVTNSKLTVSVNIKNLPIGTYNGTITIKAVNPPGSPEILTASVAPVTLTVNRITNGGFEGLPDPWVVSGLAMSSAGAHKHSGEGYLLLGASNRSSGSAYQQFVVSPQSSKLSFWLNVTSDEPATAAANDRLFVEIRDTSGRLLKTLATFSNLDKSEPGNYKLRGDYSLAQFAGRTVRIQFRTVTNSASLTSFRVDDVLLK